MHRNSPMAQRFPPPFLSERFLEVAMRNSSSKLMALVGLVGAALISCSFAAPANAQAIGDEFSSGGTTGNFSNDSGFRTGSQATQYQLATAPALQGATNGTI